MLTRDEDLIHCAGSISKEDDDRLAAEEAGKTPEQINAEIAAILRLQRYADLRDDLSLMVKELRLMADKETDGIVSGLLESAALSVHNAVEAANHEHNRLSFIASLALGGRT